MQVKQLVQIRWFEHLLEHGQVLGEYDLGDGKVPLQAGDLVSKALGQLAHVCPLATFAQEMIQPEREGKEKGKLIIKNRQLIIYLG